jgi:hypothetical protein
MRKLLRFALIGCAIALVGALAGATYAKRHNDAEVARADALGADLRQLRVGASDYKVAQSIATKFGTAPYENDYGGVRDCLAGYFERCSYRMTANTGTMYKLQSEYPLLRRLGLRNWSATSFIYIENGTVQGYSFVIVYKTAGDQWRGFGAEEGKNLPADRAVQARISDAYSIQRNDMRMGERASDLGFELESSLTPTASLTERQRAWHFELACLSGRHSCGEMCEVMPDAWHDFYINRGHFDVDKYGVAYLFCKKMPT